ncbi:NAD-dependent epimerase/dehydratase family protein [Sulfuricurvum sp.]
MNKMKILIIGANGFIGKHLREHLLKNCTYTLLTPSSKELEVLA